MGSVRDAAAGVARRMIGPAPAAGWPLVLAFHGGQSHPEMMRRFSGLDVLADRGFAAVAYPAGTGSRESLLTWNGGNCCGEAKAQESDDVGFTRSLVEGIGRRIRIDPARIRPFIFCLSA